MLQIAAFDGNAGDTGQILGFRQEMEKTIGIPMTFANLEMREFYRSWGMRRFDADFAALANSFDLVIIGGGNFWSLDWEDSATGTTIDISKEILESIRTPIWFHGLGFDDGIAFQPEKLEVFQRFLSDLLDNPQKCFVSVRNDGSIDLLAKYYGRAFAERILEVPDGGFFVSPEGVPVHPEMMEGRRTIAINPAGDMMQIRFYNAAESVNDYLDAFAQELVKLLEAERTVQIVFVAHHFADFAQIFALMERLPDVMRRRRVSIASYLPVFPKAMYLFDIYRKADLVIGGRFHSNLCAIAQGTPTIGILSYHKHKTIYCRYGMRERMLEVDKGEIRRLSELALRMLSAESQQRARRENQRLVSNLREDFAKKMKLARLWILENTRRESRGT